MSPKYLTSCPASSAPTVIVPIQVNAEPVKVKFASPSNSVVVLPIVVNLLAAWLFKAVIVPYTVAQSKFPEPSVFKTWFAEPSATGNSMATVPKPIASV